MKIEDLPRYKKLRSEMSSLPDELAAALGDAAPVGCQMFIPRCADGFHPVEISEASWATFVHVNNGKLPKELGDWEKWNGSPEMKAAAVSSGGVRQKRFRRSRKHWKGRHDPCGLRATRQDSRRTGMEGCARVL